MPKQPSSPVAEICYGPMKSGKSRYLVQQSEAFHRNGLSFLSFKPVQDTRDGSFIRSRDTACRDVQALGISTSRELGEFIRQAISQPGAFAAGLPQPVAGALALQSAFRPDAPLHACLIDEVFLLDGELLDVLTELRAGNVSVYLSGLDRDFRGEYFPLRHFERHGLTMQAVIESCDRSFPLQASCEVCAAPAELTQRLINGSPAPYDSPTVLIGDEEYEPRCREHHCLLGKPSLSAAS
ncbi:MAG TPA: hypothetical protein V6D23_04965 [Candidatus Obscuribacterales bacterium]